MSGLEETRLAMWEVKQMMRSLPRAATLVFSLTLAVWLMRAEDVRAVPLVGVTYDNSLVYFDSEAPDTITRKVAVTGLEGLFFSGIDFRPSNGFLYGLFNGFGRPPQLYVINPSTGTARLISSFQPNDPFFADLDFDPVSDELRLVRSGLNVRINPDTGAVIGREQPLAYAPDSANSDIRFEPGVTGAAYSNNFVGAKETTLYVIDANLNGCLSRVGSFGGYPISPNTGQLFKVGHLGTLSSYDIYFDIAPNGEALAAFNEFEKSALVRINLTTGKVTFIGYIGNFTDNHIFALRGFAIVPPALVQLDTGRYSASEHEGRISVNVTRGGDLTAPASVRFETQAIDGDNDAPCDARSTGAASPRCDFTPIGGTIHFAAGESTQTINLPVADDAYNELTEIFTLALSEAQGAELGGLKTAVVEILDDDAFTSSDNPIDRAEAFVRQNYHDFLSRPPDAEGLAFWTGRIAACGANSSCTDRERVNTSMGFFLSIEFQQTGFFIHQLYRAAFGRQPSFAEFLPDTQQVGRGVVVLAQGWEEKLEANRRTFLLEFVARRNFMQEFPADLTADAFVDRLFARAALAPTATERQAALDAYGTGDTEGRARCLRVVAANRRLATREFNRAFVLMEYFGYLRRDPDPAGYAFWLNELDTKNNHFNMVRAFIVSEEYRQRFGR